MTAATSVADADLIPIVQGGVNKKATASLLPAGYPAGTKLYVALLTQTGTDAPVATVLVNTLGETVVWTRNNTGDYIGTLAGVFTMGKTVAFITNNRSSIDVMLIFPNVNINSVAVSTVEEGSNADDLLSNTPIQIIVFP